MATLPAERGATEHKIMAVTGHRRLEEVERYTRLAARGGLADMAMAKVSAVPLQWDKTRKQVK